MLVEKDYWIMHGLWGLQAQGFVFELKGGTSLSKGFGVIHRFSEDIDIRIEPPADLDVKTGRNQDKPAHIASRLAYYDELAKRISIPTEPSTSPATRRHTPSSKSYKPFRPSTGVCQRPKSFQPTSYGITTMSTACLICRKCRNS
jgi:Nucleotidyl transferase AbiEii toxin, Type IV TA system